MRAFRAVSPLLRPSTAARKSAGLLASVLQDASLPMLKLRRLGPYERPARRIKDQGACALYILGIDGTRQSAEKSFSEGGKERECARWRADHNVVPDYSWGTLPVHLQKRYKAYDCDSLVPPVPEALPTGPTETVRRGWNRTAGSRYQFAADGITFESSGGI